MKKVKLGQSDLMVSEFALGTMYFSWRDSNEQSIERMDQYAEAGGNFLDTANIYSQHHRQDKDFYGKDRDAFIDGMSERIIGEWMKKKGNRANMVVATKLGFPYPGCPYGTSAAQIREECEKSLQRLQTDYIDLLYLHTDDRNTPMEESLAALDALVKEGKVRAIGASNFTAWRLAQAVEISKQYGYARYCCIQQRHSYLRNKPGKDFGGPAAQMPTTEDLFDFVRNDGMTLLAYSPLLSGAYVDSSKPLPEQYVGADSNARLAALEQVAKETGATKNQLVYAWMRQSDPSVIPLVAVSNRAQFEEAMGTQRLTLTPEQFRTLDQAGE